MIKRIRQTRWSKKCFNIQYIEIRKWRHRSRWRPASVEYDINGRFGDVFHQIIIIGGVANAEIFRIRGLRDPVSNIQIFLRHPAIVLIIHGLASFHGGSRLVEFVGVVVKHTWGDPLDSEGYPLIEYVFVVWVKRPDFLVWEEWFICDGGVLRATRRWKKKKWWYRVSQKEVLHF